jgi:excisionase family DNA binding protein
MKPVNEPEEYAELRQVLKSFVTPAEAAELLHVTPLTIRTRIAKGGISSIRAGSGVLIPRSEIARIKYKYFSEDEIPQDALEDMRTEMADA